MKEFKILISPAKTFKPNAQVFSKGITTMFMEQTKDIFKEIESFNQQEIQAAYSVSENISKEVVRYNKVWGKETYKAIDLYGGMVFKELNIKEEDEEWVNNHVLILDALYGIVKPNDYISKYRLDFKTKIDLNLKSIWSKQINSYLKDFKIYSLASKEYTDILEMEFESVETDKNIKQIKKARGIKLQQIIKEK